MVRGLKKKLLIGLLSAAVVGTSLAPNVPLVGSFAQEVKADDATSQVVEVQTPKPGSATNETVKNEVTITKPAHSTVTNETTYVEGILKIKVKADKGYRLVNQAREYEVSLDSEGKLSQTTFDSGASVALIKETLTVSKGADIADGLTYTLDKSELDINNTKAVLTIKAKDGRKFKTAPKVKIGNETGANDTTKVDDSTYKFEYTHVEVAADKTTNLEITGGVYEVLSNEPGTTEPGTTDPETPQSSTDSSSLKVNGDAVASVKIQQSGQDDKTTAASAAVSVKDGIDTVIKATLNVAAGKKVTKVEAKYTQGGITQTVNGTFDSVTKEAAFNIGKVFDGMVVTIAATVEDVKIKPTLKTSLNGATAAFEGETEVKQADGKLTIVVTPSDAKKLNDIKGKIKITVDGKNIAISEKEVPGKLYYEISGFESEKPVIVVSGGLNNNNEHISGDDYSKVVAPYNVAIDDSAVLDAYKESNESDKNTAVKIEATPSTEAPAAFNAAIAGLVAKNPYLKAAINVNVKLSAAQVDGKANSGTAVQPIDKAEFKTPIPIKVTLPSDAAGKGGYIVLRKHGDDVETLTTTLKDGEGISVNAAGTELTIYTKKLSDFTVLYDSSLTNTAEENNNSENNNGENSNGENNGSNSGSSNGTTATTSTAKAATSTTKAAKATTSTKKSSKTSSPKTADYAVNSLLALLTGAAGLFGITLINKKRKEDEE